VRWITGVLSSRLLHGCRVIEGGQSRGGSNGGETSMAQVTGDKNSEGKAMGCNHFLRGRWGGGEAAPRCQRRMTQRRVARRPGRPNAVAGVWKLMMIKENWVGGPNARLDQTTDWVNEKTWPRV
jgi:hypothetical protein